MWAKILSFAAKYGTDAVKWCWANKWMLINAGMNAYNIISDMFS